MRLKRSSEDLVTIQSREFQTDFREVEALSPIAYDYQLVVDSRIEF